MLRLIGKMVGLLALVSAGSVGLWLYYDQGTAQRQVEQLQLENREKDQIISRLQAERRVAKVVVTDQRTVDRQLKTTIMFEEYRLDGTALSPREYVIDGNEIHFDAEIVKFNDQYVKAGDPLRGQSIILFTRVYGAHQAPADGFPIDTPGMIPEVYRGIDPKISVFEEDLWSNFWKLYNDKAAREARGIRGLHGEGLFGVFDMDHVYTITVRSDGDGTLNEEPMDPIYQAAIRRQ